MALRDMLVRVGFDINSTPLGKLNETINQIPNKMNAVASASTRAEAAAKSFGTNAGASVSSFSSHLSSAVKSIGAVGAAMGVWEGAKKLGQMFVGANADMEQYQNTLTVVLKSSDKAKETLAWANQFAAQTPFEIPQIVEATTRMASYGMNAKDTLGIVGDMASVMGKDLMQAVEAVADAQTGELERLKEFGITKKMIEDQASAMHMVVTNAKGQITDQDKFNSVLFQIMQDRFKGGMAMQATTFKGLMSNMSDSFGTLGRQLGQPIFDVAKQGVAGLLGYISKLQADGTISRWVANATAAFQIFITIGRQVFGGVIELVKTVGGWFEWIGIAINEQAGGALVSLGEKLNGGIASGFQRIQELAQPILIWLIDVGFPLLQDAIVAVAVWVINVANFIANNWSWISPFVYGIAIAFGAWGAAVLLMSTYMRIASIATALLNAVMFANPAALIVIGVGLLIGAIILLAKNWDMITGKLEVFWTAIKQVWASILAYLGGKLADAREWGANIIKTMADGVASAKDALLNKVQGVFDSVRALMPFSDAKEGPFSQLTKSGGAIMTTLATGAQKQAGTLHNAITSAFQTPIQAINTTAGDGASPATQPVYQSSSSATSTTFSPTVNVQVDGSGGGGVADIKGAVLDALDEYWLMMQRRNPRVTER